MKKLKEYATTSLHISPEQVQVFTPTPSTYASVMYYTEKDPFTGKPIFVEKDLKRKVNQKEILTTIFPFQQSTDKTYSSKQWLCEE